MRNYLNCFFTLNILNFIANKKKRTYKVLFDYALQLNFRNYIYEGIWISSTDDYIMQPHCVIGVVVM